MMKKIKMLQIPLTEKEYSALKKNSQSLKLSLREYVKRRLFKRVKLSEYDKQEIINLHNVSGLSYSDIADRFGVSKSTVYKLIKSGVNGT